jgi:hypothetical protein
MDGVLRHLVSDRDPARSGLAGEHLIPPPGARARSL